MHSTLDDEANARYPAAMGSLVQELGHWDRVVLEASQNLRWGPLTILFLIASAWWVKGLVFVAVGGLGDVRARRLFPATAACTAMGAAVASALAALLKEVFDRTRPPLVDPAVTALVPTPDSASFPSGHTATAFAAAAAVGFFHPRLRWPVYGLAALVGLSRIYLGVHFWLDVLAGAALGLAIGLAAAWTSRRIACLLRGTTSGSA